MEKNRLVGFMAKVMEKSGFKVYRDFETSKHIIDIYGVLSTVLGDIGVVVACKNYDERWDVGLDVLKEMEMVAKTLKASKVVVVTTSHFTDNAVDYASRRNIKLIDKDSLINLAKSFSGRSIVDETVEGEREGEDEEEEEYFPKSQSTSRSFFSQGSKPSLSGRKKEGEGFLSSLRTVIKFLLSNTISLIIIVLLISQLLTYITVSLNSAANNVFVLGILKILFSALLSYGIVLAVDRDATVTLVKGTTVFFVSLLIYVVLIFIT